LLGFLGLIPNLFSNDLTVFMNHDFSITSSDTRYGLFELTNSLDRVINSIEYLLDSHSRLLATFDIHLLNTASNMLHYPDGSIYIYRVREYLPNGVYTFVMNLSSEELNQ
jgi:hypothetical protein